MKKINGWIINVRHSFNLYSYLFTGEYANHHIRIWLSGASVPTEEVYQQALTLADISKGFDERIERVSRTYGIITDTVFVIETRFTSLPKPEYGDDLVSCWQKVKSFVTLFNSTNSPCVTITFEKIVEYLIEFISSNFSLKLHCMSMFDQCFCVHVKGAFTKFLRSLKDGMRPTLEHLCLIIDRTIMKTKDIFKEVSCTAKKPQLSAKPFHTSALTLTPNNHHGASKPYSNGYFSKNNHLNLSKGPAANNSKSDNDRDALSAKRRKLIEDNVGESPQTSQHTFH